MNKKIWREVFGAEPHSIDYKVLHYHPQGFVEFARKNGSSNKLKDIVIIVKNAGAKRYEPADQLELFLAEIFNKIIKNPGWANKLHKQCEKFGKKLFKHGQNIQSLNLTSLSDKKLIKVHKKMVELQIRTHLVSNSIARAEAYDQRFSKYLLNRLQEESGLANKKNTDLFILLSSPGKLSFAQKEKLSLYQNLKRNPHNLETTAKNHYKYWSWVNYGYIGPETPISFYSAELKTIDKKNVAGEIKKLKYSPVIIKQKQKKVLAKLHLSRQTRSLLKLAQDLVWIKDYRKHCIYFSCFILDKIKQEMAKRLGIKLTEINFLLPHELYQVLKEKKSDTKELQSRKKCSVLKYENGNFDVLSGSMAGEYIKQMNLESKGEITLNGQCGYPGIVEGEAKIVHSPLDFKKINPGDILVTHTTSPVYLPAVSKAAALLTESGGLTCHTTIVARELKKPTVVGIKNLLHQVKDKDRLRINATKGTVIKINTPD